MRELRHWPSKACMSPQSHCGDEEYGRNGLSSCRHYTCIMLFAYIYIYIYIYICIYILKIVSIQTSTSWNKNLFLEFVWFAIITCSICDTFLFLFFSLSRHYLFQGTIKKLFRHFFIPKITLNTKILPCYLWFLWYLFCYFKVTFSFLLVM